MTDNRKNQSDAGAKPVPFDEALKRLVSVPPKPKKSTPKKAKGRPQKK